MTQKLGLNRNTADKYYTKPDVVEMCVQYVSSNLVISRDDVVVEPSAGDGAFINALKKISDNVKCFDTEPDHHEIIRQDYLDIDESTLSTNGNVNIHVIGNPPFGRQSSLAKKFIKKSCKFCSSLSFILPKSFKKASLKSTFPLNYHLIYEIDLPSNSFLVNKVEHDVPCVFQIWKKESFNRPVSNKIEPVLFSFVKKDQSPDISFRRVGVNAGAVDTNTHDKSIQSHYFIKFKNRNTTEEQVDKLKTISFPSNNTVGPKSISMQELIEEFNKIL